MNDVEPGDTGFDMDSAVASIADGLGLTEPEDDLPEGKPEGDAPPTESDAAAAPDDASLSVPPSKEGGVPSGAAAAPTPRAPPKSWAKEYHEDWSKLTPKQQEYIEKREKDMLDGTEEWRSEAKYSKQIKEMLAPYRPMFAAAGIDETQGMQYLLNAQYRLTNGTPEDRKRAFDEIGQQLGFIQAAAADPNAPPVDPAILQLRRELDGVKSALTQRQDADANAARAEAGRTVTAFASDPAHPFFDEVAGDITQFIGLGHSLADAYDKAIYANPVTRQKMFDKRLADDLAEKKEKALKEGDTAARATALNVRGAQSSRKAPTETKGKMFDDLSDILRESKNRAH